MKMKILNKNDKMIGGTIVVRNFKWLQMLLGIIKQGFKSQLIVVM